MDFYTGRIKGFIYFIGIGKLCEALYVSNSKIIIDIDAFCNVLYLAQV